MEEVLEKRFFAPLAGPERTHEPNSPRKPLPWAPILVLMLLAGLLLAVFLATIIQTWTNTPSFPPPANYYNSADVVGLCVTLVLLSFLMWSYVCVAFTDPGKVPKRWPWDPKQMDPRPNLDDANIYDPKSSLLQTARLRGIERKLDGRTRFCKKCNMYKPDRAHHCKKLGRCVLEMDHWCPWVRNTIGFYNRKFFFLTVTYGWVTLFAYCVVLGPYLVPAVALRNALDFFTILCWILAAIECLLLLALWCFHVFLTVHAFTTIEFREKHLAQDNRLARSGEKVSELYRDSLYNLGLWESVKHLLGPNPLLWLIPTRYGMPSGEDAGLYFKTRVEHPLLRLSTKLSTSQSNIGSEIKTTSAIIAT